MRLTPRTTKRPGATMVEAALVLPVFLLIIIGMIDLSIGVLRAHILSEAARQGARQAIVHGAMAPEAPNTAGKLGPWGPANPDEAWTYGPSPATDTHAVAQAIRPYLVGIDPSQVMIKLEMPDGKREEQLVRVTLTHNYQPITTYVISGTIPLSASSAMRITH